jgi:DNA end-binding protein Ku
MSALRYKEYQGGVEFDEGRLMVRLLHIDDLITTEIDSASEAQAAFVELVEDYVASCAELGKQPCKPFKGSFNVRLSPRLHKQVAFAAIEQGETLNSFVVSAIEDKIHAGWHDTTNANISSEIGPRANSIGTLRFSLVTCPIIVIPATSESEIRFDRVNENIANRVQYPQGFSDSGDEAASPWVIEIDQFVPKKEIDYLYLSNSFYIVPAGKVGHDAYAVIREVIRSLERVAIARVVSPGGEHVFAMEARGNGLLGTQVRHPHEVRDSSESFAAIQNVKVTKDMLDLAKHIVERKSGHFDPDKFWDHRVAGLRSKEIIQQNSLVEKSVLPKGGNVINLMEALRASLNRSNHSRNEKKPKKTAGGKSTDKQ